MLTVLCYKWGDKYRAAHVNALARQVARHYARPHRFVCITNDPDGIDPAIGILPDLEDYADLPSPHGGANPSCYRRLRLFHPNAAEWYGERFVLLDLDIVITGDVVPLWDRPDEFVIYRDPLYPRQFCGSMFMLHAGMRPEIWEFFDPARSPLAARRAGYRGSDQAWISYIAEGAATWGPEDGVYSYRKHIAPNRGKLPADARVTVWHGAAKPWREGRALPWVRENYAGA